MAVTVTVILNEPNIARMTMPGGMIFEYVTTLTREVLTVSIATAPILTGRMRSTLRREVGAWGPTEVTQHVLVGTEYARYVLKGTTGPIRSPRGRLLAVGASQGRRVTLAMSVRGQAANNFLGAALSRVMRSHGL